MKYRLNHAHVLPYDKAVTEELNAEAHKTRKSIATNTVDKHDPTQPLTSLLSTIYLPDGII